jgi:hypothetical protein
MGYITNDGWIVTDEMYNQIKEICPDLVFDEILRLVDIMKSDQIHK